jgi:hypothetical protein
MVSLTVFSVPCAETACIGKLAMDQTTTKHLENVAMKNLCIRGRHPSNSRAIPFWKKTGCYLARDFT